MADSTCNQKLQVLQIAFKRSAAAAATTTANVRFWKAKLEIIHPFIHVTEEESYAEKKLREGEGEIFCHTIYGTFQRKGFLANT